MVIEVAYVTYTYAKIEYVRIRTYSSKIEFAYDMHILFLRTCSP